MKSAGRVIVMANRAPFSRERQLDGSIVVRHSTSGLVAASEPLVRGSAGTWIGGASGDADADSSPTHELVPPEVPEYLLRRITLDEEERHGHYDGFCNEGLWPLCHRVSVEPVFRPRDFDTYWEVNRRFSEAAVEETLGDPAVLLVQDYHFALAPLILRDEVANCAIAAFWHIPWPSVARLEMCPWATYLIEGLLGSHLIGFQTQRHCASFLDAAEHLLGAEVERRRGVVTYLGRRTHVRAYPASVEWRVASKVAVMPADECRRSAIRQWRLRADTRIVVGVDRMDYTKGLEEKLTAFEQMLARRSEAADRAVLIQIAQPTRQALPVYRELHGRIVARVDAINRRFGRCGQPRVILLDSAQPPENVYRLLRAADVCYVGSLDDGMNLVAKEFVSAREDERGVLVLSEHAGAASELTHAVLIDPYDPDACARALDAALRMPPEEQEYRMRRMRARVQAWDAQRWGSRILEDATNLCSVPAFERYRTAVGA